MTSPQLSARALERRVRRYLATTEMKAFVVCQPGMEAAVLGELERLPFPPREAVKAKGGVELRGDLRQVYAANLSVRTATRVLLRYGHFLAQSFPMLYDHTRSLPWELVLGISSDFTASVSARSSRLSHKRRIEATVRAGIRARLESVHAPELQRDVSLDVHVRLLDDHCTLSLDTSGAPLYKRSNAAAGFGAPLRETTAAFLLLGARRADAQVLWDPFCGSGTIISEAYRMAHSAIAGSERHFAIESWPLHRDGLLREVLRQLATREGAGPAWPKRLIASDIDSHALSLAADKLGSGRGDDVKIMHEDALAIDFRSFARYGTIVCNMPYGVRVSDPASAHRLAAAFSERLLHTARDWSFAVLTPFPEVFDAPGFQQVSKVPLRSGGIHVWAVFGTVSPGHGEEASSAHAQAPV